MNVEQVLCMNKGEGENSYAKNSVVQRKIISQGRPVIEEAILDFFSCNSLPNTMGIADLGCSSGPNTLSVVSMIIEIVCSRCSQLGCPSPEFQVFINDLPGNDFNTVFRSLPEFYHNFEEDWFGFGPCFVSATPGSFYGRLFPSNSLHFVHSSSSLHWLSQVPPELESKANITPLNKSHLYISKSSPSSVLNAYSQQFEKDFSLFLRTRSKEVVPGGRMILSFMGRRAINICSEENCYLQWELLAQALRDMVSEGVVKEEKLESFNVPYYSPCPEEVETEVQKEGSFTIDRLQILEVEWDGGGDNCNGFSSEEEHNKRSCRRVTETIRAVVESMLSSHFGVDIMDDLFWRFNQIVNDVFPKKRLTYANLVISMTRKA